MMAAAICLLLVTFLLVNNCCEGLLYPKDSSTRLVKDLDGIWHFRVDRSDLRNEGFDEHWYSEPLQAVSNEEMHLYQKILDREDYSNASSCQLQ